MVQVTQVDQQFTARQVPWARLGELTEEPVSVEHAIKLSSMDFTVSLRPIQRQLSDGSWLESKHRVMVTADDTDEEFDVVSKGYSVLQYAEAFDFLSAINPKISAAGTLKDRRQGFMVVQIPGLEKIDALEFEDAHELYTIVRTSHDRTRAVECFVMPLRERCMNMMGLPGLSRTAMNRWSMLHVGDVNNKLTTAEQMIERIKAYRADFSHTVNRLYSTVLNVEDAHQILKLVVRETKAEKSRRDAAIDKIIDMWNTRETVAFAGTAWGLVNAIDEYYEWERSSANRTAHSQMLGALEGTSRKAMERAVPLILSRFTA
jgi:phage/plasmid-like protein (TIGR03299 family)